MALDNDTRRFITHGDGLAIAEKLADIADRISANGNIWHHGFRRDNTDSNPATRLTPLYDSVGVAPAYMDFTNGVFVAGGWQWLIDLFYPVMVDANGIEVYKLNKMNHQLKENGEASAAFDATSSLNAMSCLSQRIYRKHWSSGNYEYFEFSNVKLDEDFHADGYERADGSLCSKLYFPMFAGYKDSNNKLRSLGGQAVWCNTGGAQNEIDAASAMGSNFRIWDLAHRTLIEELCLLISLNDNVQAAFGQGDTSTYNASATNYGHVNTGTLYDKGAFFGYSDTTHEVKVFYIEKLWGNNWDRVLGCVLVNDVLKCKLKPPFNLTGEDYDTVGITLPASGWQKETQNTRYGSFPKTNGGSDSTYICDYWYKNASGTRVLIVGSHCDAGSACGRCWHLTDEAGGSRWALGASLLLEQPLGA